MIFTYAVDSLDETPLTIQKTLTEILEIKQSETASQDIVSAIPTLVHDPAGFREAVPKLSRALIKLHKNKAKIITRYDQILNFLNEQLAVFDEELCRCKENFAISALKIRASNIDTALDEEDDGKYCVCKVNNKGDMVACDAADCPIEWFHLECVGLTEPPKGKWICEECRGNDGK